MAVRTPRPLEWLRRQWTTAVLAAARIDHADHPPDRTDPPDLGAIEAVGDRLLDRYREPQRRYHTVEHVAEVLQTVRSLADPADPGVSFRLDTDAAYRAVSLAAWYHDAVYDPTAPGNEAASADLAVAELGALGLTPSLTAEVARLVRLTEGHDVAHGDDPAMLLVDADLAILGSRPARYDRYAADVRAEYAHVPDDAYRAGRAAVLQGFLDRGSIYHCELMVLRCDENARRNLRRELDQLAVIPPPSG